MTRIELQNRLAVYDKDVPNLLSVLPYLTKLLEALKTADMVKGSRYVKGGSVVN